MPVVTYAAEEAPAPPVRTEPWAEVAVLEAHRLLEVEGYALLDVRPAKEFGREAFRGAVNVPATELGGSLSRPERRANPRFLQQLAARFPDPGARLVVVGGADGADSREAMAAMWEAGYRTAVEVRGGYKAWCWHFLPNGRRRPPQGTYTIDFSSAGTVCVGAELDNNYKEAGSMVY
eukprot:EG_transcript_32712